MRNGLPKKIHVNESAIVNLDSKNNSGTHWQSYKKIGLNIQWFDSFGNLRPCSETLKYFNSNGPCKIVYNHSTYQTYNSYNCGHLCLKFLCNNIE